MIRRAKACRIFGRRSNTNHVRIEPMIKRLAVLGALCLLAVPAALAQTGASNDDLTNAIRSLSESNKAILQELQEIRKLLATQQAPRPVADVLPKDPISIAKDPFKGPANA